MTKPFEYRMPAGRMAQKHDNSEGKKGNNYGFLRSLNHDEAADIDLIPVANMQGDWSKKSGATIMALHSRTAAGNGYTHIMRDGVAHPMTPGQLHRDIDQWNAAEVRRWRRGPSSRSERPRTLGDIYRYVKKNGGTVIGELKYPQWSRHSWLHDDLIAIAKRNGHSPLFKSLYNQAGIHAKARMFENARKRAGIKSGGFAVIAGNHHKGRGARLKVLNNTMKNWPAELKAVTRKW